MISAYVGPNGAGKTMLAVESMILKWKRDKRQIWSTVDIVVDDELITKRITDWGQLMKQRDVDVLLDEVATLASGRETMTLPPLVLAWMGSLRHRNVAVTWTSPSWMDADVKLRQVTQVLYEVIPLKHGRRIEGKLWKPTTWARVRTYDMTSRRGEPPTKDEKKGLTALYRIRSSKAFGTFDSEADVNRLTEYGTVCPVCGGMKRRPICKCRDTSPHIV